MAACSLRSSTARLIAAAERAGCELHPHAVPTLGSTLGASHAGQMLPVRASSAAAAHDRFWCGGTEPAISHPGLRGCVPSNDATASCSFDVRGIFGGDACRGVGL